MIAEIHGKMTDSNLDRNQRLEDELTGNVFGTLRYMPYSKGLKQILECVKGDKEEKIKEALDKVCNDCPDVEFWDKKSWGEVDVHIETSDLSINVEVKYNSPESGDDQLQKYSENIGNDWGKGKKCILLILAKVGEAQKIYNTKIENNQIDSSVEFGYICWEDVYDRLLKIKEDENSQYSKYEMLMIEDTIAFLEERGLDGFRGFGIAEKIKRLDFFDFQFALWDCDIVVNKEDLYYEFK